MGRRGVFGGKLGENGAIFEGEISKEWRKMGILPKRLPK